MTASLQPLAKLASATKANRLLRADQSGSRPRITAVAIAQDRRSYVENVKYNSVSKSRDIGLVNNFLGQFGGNIGSEVGSPTLFFKVDLIGDASLQIKKNKVNRFTDNHISVGILDANRKPVLVNDSGLLTKMRLLQLPSQSF